jgi:23S rRNA (adenine2503-C2)-methyltransferase
MESKLNLIYDLDLDKLKGLVVQSGEPSYRANQIWQGIYHHYWQIPDDFTNLPVEYRQKLAGSFIFTSLQPVKILKSADNQTIKTLFKLIDNLFVEAVLMLYEDRRTLCISTQVGCAMGCVFCATGQMGFQRNLTSGEIVEQVIYYARLLKSQGENITNVVVMGMGEPFHNYASTLSAIDRLNHPDGMNLGARRFTISTVGLVPMIRKFANEKRQINLAISLHEVNDEHRSSLLPVNKKYPIDELLDACRYYVEKTGRRITFEWALIQGVNDSTATAEELSKKLKGLLCHVNLIPLNPTHHYDGQPTRRDRVDAFRDVLEKVGIPCTIRIRRGIEIEAGCGQLANLER